MVLFSLYWEYPFGEVPTHKATALFKIVCTVNSFLRIPLLIYFRVSAFEPAGGYFLGIPSKLSLFISGSSHISYFFIIISHRIISLKDSMLKTPWLFFPSNSKLLNFGGGAATSITHLYNCQLKPEWRGPKPLSTTTLFAANRFSFSYCRIYDFFEAVIIMRVRRVAWHDFMLVLVMNNMLLYGYRCFGLFQFLFHCIWFERMKFSFFTASFQFIVILSFLATLE